MQYGTTGPGGLSGGYTPLYNTNTDTIQFGYNWSTVTQSIAINQALSGVGIQIRGYNWSWTLTNGHSGTPPGTLYGSILSKDAEGNVIHQMVNNYSGQQLTNQTFSGTQLYTNPYNLSQLNSLSVEFVGKDATFWAGYYGPLVSNIDVRLRYSVDPCAANPTYSVDCAGFNAVVTSPNQVPYPNDYAAWGSIINNSYAIQAALSAGDTGLKVHGFDWGYRVHSNEPYCAFWFLGCFDPRDPLVRTNVSITSNTGASLYSVTRDYNDINGYQNFNYSYRFPTSRNLGNLGNFNFTGQTWDNASIDSMYSRIVYTPDTCMKDPTSSPTCPGYSVAIAGKINTTSTTSDPITTVTEPIVTNNSPVATAIQSAPIQTTVIPESTSIASVSQSSTTQSGSNSSSGNRVSLSTILNIVGAEQSRISSVERSVVDASVQQALRDAERTTQQAERTAAQSTSDSISMSITGVRAQTSTEQQMASQSSGGGLNFLSASSGLLSPSGTNSTGLRVDSSREQTAQTEEIKTESAISFSGFSAVNALKNEDRKSELDQQATQVTSTVRSNVQNNELAGGIGIETLAANTFDFNSYLNKQLVDARFYKTEEIYKNNQPVDNRRLLRLLNGASDRLHQEMVDEQYRRN